MRAIAKLNVFLVACSTLAFGRQIAPSAQRQIAALLAEKASRTPAQRKMNSHLVHAARVLRGETFSPDFPIPKDALSAVHMDSRHRVEVDVKADVTPELLAYVGAIGGTVVNSFPQYHALRASLPLLAVEKLADRSEVKQVRSAEQEVHDQLPPPVPAASAPLANHSKKLADEFSRFWKRRPQKGLRAQPPFRSQGGGALHRPRRIRRRCARGECRARHLWRRWYGSHDRRPVERRGQSGERAGGGTIAKCEYPAGSKRQWR